MSVYGIYCIAATDTVMGKADERVVVLVAPDESKKSREMPKGGIVKDRLKY